MGAQEGSGRKRGAEGRGQRAESWLLRSVCLSLLLLAALRYPLVSSRLVLLSSPGLGFPASFTAPAAPLGSVLQVLVRALVPPA